MLWAFPHKRQHILHWKITDNVDFILDLNELQLIKKIGKNSTSLFLWAFDYMTQRMSHHCNLFCSFHVSGLLPRQWDAVSCRGAPTLRKPSHLYSDRPRPPNKAQMNTAALGRARHMSAVSNHPCSDLPRQPYAALPRTNENRVTRTRTKKVPWKTLQMPLLFV